MPVDSVHPHYALYAPAWQMIRDAVDGELIVKNRGTTYLPMLEPEDYQDYLINARFYNATGRTIQGLLGAAFRVPPMAEVPVAMEPWLLDVSLSEVPLEAFIKKDVEDKLQTGRYGIRVDMREGGGRPYLVSYTAENISYWREGVVNGRRILTTVRLKEIEFAPGKDEFEVEKKDVFHVLDLEQGFCRLRIFRQVDTGNNRMEWIGELQPPPTRMGQRLTFIPFVFDGVSESTPDCEKPPLLDLVTVNYGHYRLTADYYDAMRFTSKPQPWVSGLTDSDTKMRIGSRYAWTLPAGAQTGYLEYSGAGIADIRQALNDDESRMARLGAAVLEEPKEGVESAETASINQSGKTSLLASITGTTGHAMSKALRIMAWWGGLTNNVEDESINLTMNSDFIEARMSASELEALVRSWQARGISRDTLTYNIKRGGLLPDERTIEDEHALIDAEEPPMPQGQPENLDEEEAEEEIEEEEAA